MSVNMHTPSLTTSILERYYTASVVRRVEEVMDNTEFSTGGPRLDLLRPPPSLRFIFKILTSQQ
jgi:hypothetical protein